MTETSSSWFCQHWDELQLAQLYALLAARQAVFVVEQNCPYQDADGLDPACLHLWQSDAQGRILAYARLLPPGLQHPEASIGRVLTSAAGRGRGLGRALMHEAITRISTWQPGQPLRIDAQNYLRDFYASLGFIPEGPIYLLDGIDHVQMVRPAQQAVPDGRVPEQSS